MANLDVPTGGGPPVPTRQQPGAHRGVRAGLGQQGHHHGGRARGGRRRARPTYLEVPDHLQVSDHTLHRPRPAPDRALDADRHPRRRRRTSGRSCSARSSGPSGSTSTSAGSASARRTGLDFPNESGGLLLDVDDWSGTSIGSIPIGQGIAVTRDADARGLQRHRQRRRVRRAAARARPPSTPRAAGIDAAPSAERTGWCRRRRPGRCAT